MVPDSQSVDSTVQTVSSADGTRLAYEQHGSGPPLVCLHGGSATRRDWDAVRPHLAEEFTVYVPDRRGRGDSGDSDAYALEKEIADLRAIVEAVDGTPTVFGHSFGGLVALAAAASVPVDRLVLYEPAVLVDEHRGEDLADRMDSRLDAGHPREAMRLFLEEAGGIPDVDQVPWWPEGVNVHLAETVVRENREVEAYRLPEDPGITVPTLLVTGEHGPDHLRDGVFALDRRLADSRVVELAGVGHVGSKTAPDRLAAAVTSFIE